MSIQGEELCDAQHGPVDALPPPLKPGNGGFPVFFCLYFCCLFLCVLTNIVVEYQTYLLILNFPKAINPCMIMLQRDA